MAQFIGECDRPAGTDGNHEALYMRVRNDLLDRINRDEYAPGMALPSENELAKIYGTTRLTVRNALDGLVEQGLVRRIQGKGAFVCSRPGDQAGVGGVPAGFRASMRLKGLAPSVRVLAKSKRTAGEHFGRLFGIEPDDLLYCVRRLNSVNGTPVAIENTLVPMPLFPTIDTFDITAFSLYETYGMLGHPVDEAHQKLGIARLDAHDARLLQVEVGSPALLLECLSLDSDGRIIELARSVNCGRRGGFTYRF